MVKKSIRSATSARASSGRRMPSRVAKKRLRERLQQDTQAVNDGYFIDLLRKQGYEELPLDELQDRLSKLQSPLAEMIVKGRG